MTRTASTLKTPVARWTIRALALSLSMGIAVLLAGCDTAPEAAAQQPPPAAHEEHDDPAHADEHAHGHDDHDAAHDEHAEDAGDAHEHDAHGHDAHGHDAGAEQVTLTSEAIRRNNIQIAVAQRQALTETIVAPAHVAYNAERVAHIGSVVTGRVAELKARLGDDVQQGDVLLVVDSPELGEAQSEYLQRRTAVDVARPAVELAKSAFDRAQQLYEQSQGISLTEVQNRQREYQTAAGALQTAETAVTAAENRLHLLGMDHDAIAALAETGEIDPAYVIRAPIAGQVIEREATLGELVRPDKEKLMVLADLSTIWVLADIPEARLGEIATGAPATLTVPALGIEPFVGTVSYISPELDPATRTARVRVEVPNDSQRLRPGMFAQAEIAAGPADGEPVLAVPDEAVQTVEGAPAVFVPVEGQPNTFAPRSVSVGQPIGGMVPVHAGLEPGEPYVASGSFILKAEHGKAGAVHEH